MLVVMLFLLLIVLVAISAAPMNMGTSRRMCPGWGCHNTAPRDDECLSCKTGRFISTYWDNMPAEWSLLEYHCSKCDENDYGYDNHVYGWVDERWDDYPTIRCKTCGSGNYVYVTVLDKHSQWDHSYTQGVDPDKTPDAPQECFCKVCTYTVPALPEMDDLPF